MRVSSNSSMSLAESKVFGSEMRRLRQEAGLTTTEFAKYVGVTPTYISNLELANRKPSPQLAERIAGAFDVAVSDMLKPYADKVTEERREFGKKYARARAEKGFPASVVAGALGIPPAVYKDFESGNCTLTERHLGLLDTLLGFGEEAPAEVKVEEPVEVKVEESVEICNIILEHITDLKVDKDTQRKVWHYFSKVRLDAEERRLFG